MSEASTWIKINRAPVLTLWAAVVAERLGFDRPTALTLGQAVAGSSAYAKGVSLGIIEPRPELVRERGDRLAEGERLHVDLLGRAVPVVRTDDGLRAVSKGKPGNPAQIERYLAGKFGERLGDARQAMAVLAAAHEPADLYRLGFRLYEQFRPAVPTGEFGLGSEGRAGSEEGASLDAKGLDRTPRTQHHRRSGAGCGSPFFFTGGCRRACGRALFGWPRLAVGLFVPLSLIRAAPAALFLHLWRASHSRARSYGG